MHIINARNLAHDFGVKLSPCMCSHVRLTWLFMSGEDLATYMRSFDLARQ